MLVALITVLFLSGGSQSQLLDGLNAAGKRVETTVVAGDRRAEAKAIIKKMKSKAKGHEKEFKQVAKSLKNIFSEHEFSESEANEIWQQYFEGTVDFRREMVVLQFELRDQISREEWNAIFAD
jgi:hypothetical protein